MKEYKIYYEESGTQYNYCRAWVNAESEEEAINALKSNDWDKILDSECLDTDYGDDYCIAEIGSVEEVKQSNEN